MKCTHIQVDDLVKSRIERYLNEHNSSQAKTNFKRLTFIFIIELMLFFSDRSTYFFLTIIFAIYFYICYISTKDKYKRFLKSGYSILKCKCIAKDSRFGKYTVQLSNDDFLVVHEGKDEYSEIKEMDQVYLIRRDFNDEMILLPKDTFKGMRISETDSNYR